MSADNIVPLLQEILSRLTILEGKVGGGGAGSGNSGDAAEVPRSVAAFDDYLRSFVDPFVAAATKLGGDAQASAHFVKEGFDELRNLILQATACKEPSKEQLPAVLTSISSKIKAANSNVKRNEWEKHTKTLAEGIGMLNWVVVKPAPRDFIETHIGASDYWANGIRKEHRTTNPDQIAFCDTFKNIIIELGKYVKEFHTTGLSWNKNGVDVSEYKGAASTPATATPSAAAAPAKPAATATTTASTATKPAAPTGNLFAELNKEGAITSGLKKVTKDMQTWRAEYKADSSAPAPAAKAVAPKTAPSAANQVKGPPKLEYQDAGSKWVVENQSATPEPLTIEIKDKKETVYIYGCVGATISVKGKCKSIVVDSCKRTNVFFEAAMASVEIVNSQRMNIHCLNTVSSVAIDKTDGIVVHLPATSLTTEIVASKSSEMNVSFPDPNGEIIERPIPEQYVHRIQGTTVTANVSDLYSHQNPSLSQPVTVTYFIQLFNKSKLSISINDSSSYSSTPNEVSGEPTSIW